MSKKKALVCCSLGLTLPLICSSDVSAQQKCKVSEAVAAENSTYTQQHVIDVGDVPGHQVRIYEIHRKYPNDKPNCEGLKRTESWDRGYSDYIDRNGRTWGYSVIVLENGDRIFQEFDGASHTTVGSDGSKQSVVSAVTTYVGGTGKYKGIRGIERVSALFDPDKNFNQIQTDGEYWLEK
jgi:hypothetical protein